jgi:hypothetical protein
MLLVMSRCQNNETQTELEQAVQDNRQDPNLQPGQSTILANGATVEQTLRKIDPKFDSVVANFPSFQLAVPVHCESWDVIAETPLVAVAPQGIREDDVPYILAYDAAGTEYELSAKEAPKQATGWL